MKQLALVLCLYLVSLFAGAQTIHPENISITDGLSSSYATGIFQDSYGLIWVPTQHGLNVYDGYRIRTFKNRVNDPNSLINDYVWHVDEDQDKNIWIATNRGISKYIRAENRFVNYSPEELLRNISQPITITPTEDFIVYNVFVDSRNTVWATSWYAPILRYNNQSDSWDIPGLSVVDSTYSVFSLPDIAYPIAEDNDGRIWVGNANHGLMVYDEKDNVFRQELIQKKPKGFNGFDRTRLITSIYVDRENTLWIAGRNGVYKYDPGKKELIIIIEYGRENPGNNSIFSGITCDNEGNIWVVNHDQSLLRFQGISDIFDDLFVDGEINPYTGRSTLVLTGVMVDDAGLIWFSTTARGVLKYNPYSEPFVLYTHDPNDPQSISVSFPFGIHESLLDPGKIYVGARGGGLNIFDSGQKTFTRVSYPAKNDMFGGSVRSTLEEPDGSIWIGTWGDGLLRLDRNYQVVEQHVHDPDDPATLSGNAIRLLKKDARGNLWLGGVYLNIFNPETKRNIRISDGTTSTYPAKLIETIRQKIFQKDYIAAIRQPGNDEDITRAFTVDRNGEFLIVAAGEGLFSLDSVMWDYGWLENQIGETIWTSASVDETNYLGGNFKNRVKAGIIALQAGDYSLRYLSDESHAFGVWNADPPSDSLLWGIHIFPLQGQAEANSIRSLLTEEMNTRFVRGTTIRDIHFSENGIVWIGTMNGGLTKYNLKTQESRHYPHDPMNPNSLINNSINGIYEDPEGILWIATDGGLNRFDPESEVFEVYTEEHGLPTDFISSILPGDAGTLWMSTLAGITQMIPAISDRKPTFVNYDITDGLGGTNFIPLVALKSSLGMYYFGGEHGLVEFGDITANQTPPRLIITDFKISNRSVLAMGSESPLTTSIYDLKEITLRHNQNDLGFEFAALHYANPSKNQYAHMLEGYDREWVYDNSRTANYTNLDPGEYVLRVRGANRDGIWDEEGLAIRIKILPPWWKTTVAYMIYFLLFCGLVYAIDRFQRRRLAARERERNREKELLHAREIETAYHELGVAHETLKSAQEQLVQQEKLASLGQLTAGIAHEIKNPLNFVNNFSDVSIELVDEIRSELELIVENIHVEKIHEFSLPTIIFQTLDDIEGNLRKIHEHGTRADNIVKAMLLHSRNSGRQVLTDINALADEYLRLAYHGMRAADKSFHAAFHTELDTSIPKICIAPQDIGRVLLNLINNAFQAVAEKSKSGVGANNYSPQKGAQTPPQYTPTVTISTKNLGDQVEIRISDNGSGIPADIKDKIFQPFFTTKPAGQGTGLGLSLSYDIVKAHGGDLRVESKEEEGTAFSIMLSQVNNSIKKNSKI